MHRRTTVTLLALLLAFPLQGASKFVDRHPPVADALTLLDLWIQEQLDWDRIPGLAIGIVYDQELIWAKGYGISDHEASTPVTPQTIFRIGSVTKLFTATAVMQLRDAGKLQLDDPLTDHLPWFDIQGSFEDAGPITIRHLLTHTSGLPREAPFPYWTDHEFPDLDALKASVPSQSMLFPPGEKYQYSNLGMGLLGHVVAAVSGLSYDQYVRTRIFEPLEMEHSTVVLSEDHRAALSREYGLFLPDDSRRELTYYDAGALRAMGNITSTVEDLARFAALQFRQGPAGGSQLLKGSSLAEMHRPHHVYGSWSGGRGLGFWLLRRENKTLVGHSGWIGAHLSRFIFSPAEKIAVIVLINTEASSTAAIAYQAYDLVGPAIVAAVAPPPEKRVASAGWKKYLGTYADPWGWEVDVLILDKQLVLYGRNYPPDDDAGDNLTRLTHVEKHAFRTAGGQPVVFELDRRNRVTRIRRGYNYIYPVE
ncbi:MAG: serine hydrolase domain-containing protein [Candidatus Neomarinimicrobiota bacterium]